MGVLDELDWNWASLTGGVLSRRQAMRLGTLLLAVLPSLLDSKVRTALGGHGAARLDDLAFPDTPLARDAERRARERLSAPVYEHSWRTYYFGRALARYDRAAAVDDELAFVAAMLHDIELENPIPGRCFAVRGAEYAEAALTELGETPERMQLVRDGIAQHITLGLSDLSTIAGLLASGAGLDLFGLRWPDMDQQWLTTVLTEHPRRNFKSAVIQAARAEVAAVPDGRLALIYRTGWELLVLTAPWAS
ncbi:HD domain-containing protein [Nocardia abscessus]|uniref:HD domain-containing protein n=1 Tax=Nocardia abscessus TaxID=120957 RepID=A0ABS0CG33_9NOCA|nr:HD domain-containing protein [Nocardia abscessus]MBF6229281.1 HD domain-containing protein [Nocardia abscessus]